MKFFKNIFSRGVSATLSRGRICFALAVALITDALQFGLGPFGWVLIDEGLDVLAMLLISGAIGFHTLLLPTFVIELIPGPDLLPTWTACTSAVIMLRKKSQPKPAIDVAAEVTPVPPEQVDHSAGVPPLIRSTGKG